MGDTSSNKALLLRLCRLTQVNKRCAVSSAEGSKFDCAHTSMVLWYITKEKLGC